MHRYDKSSISFSEVGGVKFFLDLKFSSEPTVSLPTSMNLYLHVSVHQGLAFVPTVSSRPSTSTPTRLVFSLSSPSLRSLGIKDFNCLTKKTSE